MRTKMIWGLATLFILFVCVSVYLLTRTTEPEPENVYRGDVEPSRGTSLPAAPGSGNKLESVPVSQISSEPTAAYGITRQGKRYKINPAHADVPAANATPTGPPLNIDWQDGGGPPPGSRINWRDPRTWESYRNFWGFEPPAQNPQTGREYTPTLDNWGTPLQHFRGTFIIVRYQKHIGFRPSPEQLAAYKQLKAQLETARVSGDNLLADTLRQDIRSLMNSARGELPTRHTFFGVGYGPAGFADDPEQEKAIREAADRELYKRMGIEHLYEFYEKGE